MKRWIFVQAGMLVAIMIVCWLIKLQLTPVANARVIPRTEIYVQAPDGLFVSYDEVRIVPIEEETVAEPTVTKTKAKSKPRHNLATRRKPRPRIKDEGNTSGRIMVASAGTSIVFSAEPNAREKVYKRYSHWQRHKQTWKTMERIAQYQSYIDEYSTMLGLDKELPWGLFAVESAGRPNAVSRVGAKGLGQIYKVPKVCHRRAEEILGVDRVNVWNPRENIVLSLVTLEYYTRIKNNNLLMGLVSYNCGPGHRSVVRASSYDNLNIKYGIKLYPIDVLALTLVAKVKKQYGEILPYTEENRQKIESIYLPGLGM